VVTARVVRRSNPYVLVRSARRRSELRRTDRSILPDGYQRVLHHHVRKTAGTSLNAAFRALGGPEAVRLTGEDRARTGGDGDGDDRPDDPGRGGDRDDRVQGSSIRANGLTFVTGATSRIDEGTYFFANSHRAYYALHPPRGTFRVTILRNPATRLVSHYRYLRHLRETGLSDGPGEIELARAEGTFEEFVRATPRRGLLRQLYMFSESFDVGEAARRIVGLDAVLFTETYPDDLSVLARRLDLPLDVHRERTFAYTTVVTPDEVRPVLPILADEFDLIERVARGLGRDPGPILGATPT
jgi:hypothetical protein